MVPTRDGKGFNGFWRTHDGNDWSLDWNLKKISNSVGSCPNWKPKSANADLVEKNLAGQGRVRLF